MPVKLLLFICCILFCHCAESQVVATADSLSQKASIPADTSNIIFTKTDKEAEFPGGNEGWKKYLMKNLDGAVPIRRNAAAGRYPVTVVFIVSKEGKISGIRAQTSHGFGMEEELIRIIKKGPKWIPALKEGNPVNAYRRQSVTFVVGGG